MQVIAGADAYMLREESPALHMHTLKLAVIDPATTKHRINFERFKQLAVERLPLYPPFRNRVIEEPLPFTTPLWLEQGTFDADYHLKQIKLTAPGGELELNQLMSEVISTQLRRDRPLWQVYFVEGLQHGHIAYLLKIHHALADGAATATLALGVFQRIHEELPKLPPQHKLQPLLEAEPIPARQEVIKLALKASLRNQLKLPGLLLRSLYAVMYSLKRKLTGEPQAIRPFSCAATRFNQAPTANRIVSHVMLSLADLQTVKHAFACTINDVLLTLTGGALRNYLQQRDELPKQAISAVVPVSVRLASDDPTFGNAVSQWFASTGSHIEDPVERIRIVTASTRAARNNFAGQSPTLSREWFDLWPLRKLYIIGLPKLITSLLHRPSYNIIVSNVPGPREELYSEGGKLVGIRSIGPITRQQGLNITAWSYLDQFSITLQACCEYAPDLDELAQAFIPELNKLLKIARS
jgi:WS/DGAT/MGAT family acyltransferase